ncbi:T9SS type A sorting domain-containing protein [Aequorivita sp. H23M31]|uniref:T9SS type A sorting domain-containing protein n=1 Tax=Aequorivita ciconiae TaxID=2494375 RepID=A0A410G3B0_9FLAO|nr:LamG-like jellyroll fold domain-containing protein [Aequorivita sp. H23M31]QAA81729.1 T9SS type A sorting domain-containing protein [Aequorivita sp. H23M31]
MKQITFLLLLISFPCLSQIDRNMLLHYKFDGNTLDETANNFHGLPSNITYVEDRFGNENSAVYFNGTNSFVDLPNVQELKPQLPVSFSFWIKYDSSNYQDRAVFNTSFEEDISSGIFFNAEAVSGKYGVSFGDGSFAYTPNTRRSYTSNQTVVNNIWHNITLVINGPLEMEIYIDCKEAGGTYSGFGGDLFYSLTPGSLGRHDRDLANPADYFRGSMDDFKFWDRALNQEEIYLLCENLGTPEIKESSFIIHPNPAQNLLQIEGIWDEDTSFQIFDSFGKLVRSHSLTRETDISDLSNGLYYVKFISDRKIYTRKLIVK